MELLVSSDKYGHLTFLNFPRLDELLLQAVARRLFVATIWSSNHVLNIPRLVMWPLHAVAGRPFAGMNIVNIFSFGCFFRTCEIQNGVT